MITGYNEQIFGAERIYLYIYIYIMRHSEAFRVFTSFML